MPKSTDAAGLLSDTTRRQFISLAGRLASLAIVLPALPGGRALAAGLLPSRAVKTGVSYFGGRDIRHVREDMADIAAQENGAGARSHHGKLAFCGPPDQRLGRRQRQLQRDLHLHPRHGKSIQQEQRRQLHLCGRAPGNLPQRNQRGAELRSISWPSSPPRN